MRTDNLHFSKLPGAADVAGPIILGPSFFFSSLTLSTSILSFFFLFFPFALFTASLYQGHNLLKHSNINIFIPMITNVTELAFIFKLASEEHLQEFLGTRVRVDREGRRMGW
jgi:hypothetical protein